jgi:dTDP-4-dehydrorhamnose 3,5-epimerase
MIVTPTKLPEVLLIEPKVFGDARGFFLETWSRDRYREHGVVLPFVQDNLSRSERGVLRGLHLQEPFGQGKLVSVPLGEVYDVAVDVRVGSPNFGQGVGYHLSGDNHRQLYIPPGFAHGFCVLSDVALFSYKCTELYHPEAEVGVLWNDPDIGLTWPNSDPKLSVKDAASARLRDIPEERLPRFEG